MNCTTLRDEPHRPGTPCGVRPATGPAAALLPPAQATDGTSPRPPRPASSRPVGLATSLRSARGRPDTERDLRPSRIPRLPRLRVRGYERDGYTAVTRRQHFLGASLRPVRKYPPRPSWFAGCAWSREESSLAAAYGPYEGHSSTRLT